MKITFRLIVLSPIFILFMNCKNPSAEFSLIWLDYTNSSGETGVTTFDYTENNNPAVSIWELTDGSRNSVNFYNYDKRGNITEKYREFSDSLITRQQYFYDKQHRLVRETFKGSNGRTGEVDYLYKNGRPEKAVCNGLNGWFTGNLIYHYNETGQKSTADILMKAQKAGTISYEYNDDGLLVREHWDFSGKWTQTFIRHYEKRPVTRPSYFTSANAFIALRPGLKVLCENYKYNDSVSGPSNYYYDEFGKLTEKRFLRNDGVSTRTWFLYNSHGQLIKSYRQHSAGHCWVFNYCFNDDNKLVERDFIRTDGITGNEKYFYKNDKLIRADWKNFDTWLTGKLAFTYDGIALKSALFTGDEFTAAIDIQTNEFELPETIVWQFSFGATQEYQFEYK